MGIDWSLLTYSWLEGKETQDSQALIGAKGEERYLSKWTSLGAVWWRSHEESSVWRQICWLTSPEKVGLLLTLIRPSAGPWELLGLWSMTPSGLEAFTTSWVDDIVAEYWEQKRGEKTVPPPSPSLPQLHRGLSTSGYWAMLSSHVFSLFLLSLLVYWKSKVS